MKMNMMKWIDDTIASEKKKPLPVLSFPAIQKMGITVTELINSSDLQAQAMKLITELVPDMAASVSLMDLSLEAEAFGSEIRFSEGEVPTVIGHIISDEDEAEALEIPSIGTGRTAIYIEAVKKAAEIITDRPVFAGCIGPFSLAGRLVDVSEAMIYCFEEPDMMHTVLEKVTAFLVSYINAYKEAGANGVLMAEPLAGLLSPALEEEFSCEYVKKIVEACQTENFLVAYHNCGNATVKQIESISTNGCRMLHFGNSIKMAEMMPKVPAHIIAMGNVDPANQFRNGTPESIKAATKELLRECSKYPNFVISSGCDIPPLSSWDNINAFFEGVREFCA